MKKLLTEFAMDLAQEGAGGLKLRTKLIFGLDSHKYLLAVAWSFVVSKTTTTRRFR